MQARLHQQATLFTTGGAAAHPVGNVGQGWQQPQLQADIQQQLLQRQQSLLLLQQQQRQQDQMLLRQQLARQQEAELMQQHRVRQAQLAVEQTFSSVQQPNAPASAQAAQQWQQRGQQRQQPAALQPPQQQPQGWPPQQLPKPPPPHFGGQASGAEPSAARWPNGAMAASLPGAVPSAAGAMQAQEAQAHAGFPLENGTPAAAGLANGIPGAWRQHDSEAPA